MLELLALPPEDEPDRAYAAAVARIEGLLAALAAPKLARFSIKVFRAEGGARIAASAPSSAAKATVTARQRKSGRSAKAS